MRRSLRRLQDNPDARKSFSCKKTTLPNLMVNPTNGLAADTGSQTDGRTSSPHKTLLHGALYNRLSALPTLTMRYVTHYNEPTVGVRLTIGTSSLRPYGLLARYTLRQFQYRTFPTFQHRKSRLHVNAHDVWHPRKSIPTVRSAVRQPVVT